MSLNTSFRIYQELMPHRVKEILVISSHYDAFIMEEDGGLIEHVFMSYRGVSLVSPPKFTMVSTLEEALAALRKKSYDLVVTMPRHLGMDIITFGKEIKKMSGNVPFVLLVHSVRGLSIYAQKIPRDAVDKIFVWSGNRNIMWTIIKWVEDRMNVTHDTRASMVRVLLLVEDSPLYYSSLLPILYESIVQQTQDVLEDGLNEEHRLLKLRARPKILLAENYEEAINIYTKYRPYIIGIFSDTRYPRNDVLDNEAGLHLLKKVKKEVSYIPSLLLSSDSSNKEKANSINAQFLDKNSESLHVEVRRFLADNLGFGDFIFRMPTGEIVNRAQNLRTMEKILHDIPDQSLLYHASGHHFSNWFMARSQIRLASKIRAAKYIDFANVGEIRKFLISNIRKTRMQQQRGVVVNYENESFDPESEFLKIGNGSLGGKARGLAFMSRCLQVNIKKFKKFKNVNICIPKTLVIATDCYDDFVKRNNLENFSEIDCTDELVASRFLEANLPESLEHDLRIYLEKVTYPLAIRSSSLLEDSLFQPYAGIYKTYMLPNNDPDFNERFRHLSRAIRLIYSSVFFNGPKAYSRSTLHRTEEEKMAIIIQELTGEPHSEKWFYPILSGTAQTHNFYPVSYMKAEDGMSQMAVGLGKTVVEGGLALRFTPKYPQMLPNFSTVEQIIKNSPQYFYALKMQKEPNEANELWINDDVNLFKRSIDKAKQEYPVKFLSSSYMPMDHQIRDTMNSKGIPIVTFANILKYGVIPLPEILTTVLQIAKEGLGCDIEIEYSLKRNKEDPSFFDFVILQVRPMITNHNDKQTEISEDEKNLSICYSTNALGRDSVFDIRDVIFVKPDSFSIQKTIEIASEISKINEYLEKKGRKYLLVGPGRWGSSDRMLGIPVSWKDISAVGGIIEASLENFKVDPSQGTHFFQNITSLGILYITVHNPEDSINWQWFYDQEYKSETEFIRHIKLEQFLTFKIDGNTSEGVIL